ncbi:MAG TPA: amino acid racemase [Ramlibacter sp.]|uniref:aspartate/glutamate racemase family protein n=1 Tax=Ramlibacter sp. TaxID=1917967 RepID=UPI002ED41352
MLGVLGGMGPAAGAWFAYRLALLTGVTSDQEHLPVLLVNDPRIPDRSEAALSGGTSPLPAMQERLRFLESSGCECAVIPCNTAHHWFSELQASVKIPLIHIVPAAIAGLRARGIGAGPIGLLGTRATVRSDLYRGELAAAGFTVLPYTQDDVERLCVRPIQAVKQNRVAEAAAALAEAIHTLKGRGAHAVILGCTELPVAFAALAAEDLDLPVVDSIDALAVSALGHFGLVVNRSAAAGSGEPAR